MEYVTSKDGTKIAIDKVGSGQLVVLVGGALSDRMGGASFAALMAPHFTVYTIDRRGRGDSGDTPPYAVRREIEDIEAVIDKAGGSAFVYGMSSGGVLSLETANAIPNKVKRLAVYETPFILTGERQPMRADYEARLAAALDEGRRGDALALFMGEAVGAPAEMIAGMRNSPMWGGLEKIAPTLLYDNAVMGGRMAGKPLPKDSWSAATMPTLVLVGGASEAWMQNAGRQVAEILPNAQFRVLPGQTHNVDPSVVVPVVLEFFNDG